MTRTSRFVKALITSIGRTDTSAYASALAYNFIFSLFPMLLFLTALLGFLHLPNLDAFFHGPGAVLMAPSLRHLLQDTIVSANRDRSPAILSVGALGFLYGMSGAFRRLIDALNHAYGYTERTRKGWKTVLLSVALGVVLGLFLTVVEAIMTLGTDIIRVVSMALAHQQPSAWFTLTIRWGALLIIMWVILTMIYNWLPDRVPTRRWFTPGTGLVMILWILISVAFAFYASHFSHYNRYYGSLGTVILLMLYLYIVGFLILIGAQIDILWFKDESKR